jgi:hypothetical protein
MKGHGQPTCATPVPACVCTNYSIDYVTNEGRVNVRAAGSTRERVNDGTEPCAQDCSDSLEGGSAILRYYPYFTKPGSCINGA